MEKNIEYLLTKRYEITTHSIALIDHKNIDVVGIPLTEINGEVYENHKEVVNTKFTIDKIIRTYKFNIPISVKYKSNLPEFVEDLEELIRIMHSKKSKNMLEHKIILPRSPDINLDDVVGFYNSLVFNNKKLVISEMTKKLDESFEILGSNERKSDIRNFDVYVGENMLKEISSSNDHSGNKIVKHPGGLKDGY